jgi:hypothetical protein
MLLGVYGMFFIGLPVEMNGQTGDDKQGTLEIKKKCLQRIVAHPAAYPAGNGKSPVEPWIQQGTAVDLYTQLMIMLIVDIGARFDLETGTVTMSAKNPETFFCIGLRTQRKGDNGSIFPYHKIGIPFFKFPGILLSQVLKPMISEAACHSGNRMKRGWGGYQKVKKIFIKSEFIHVGIFKKRIDMKKKYKKEKKGQQYQAIDSMS